MLVLSRNEGEGITFPELDIAIQILRIAGNRVRVGVTAPDEIRVLRGELVDRAQQAIARETEPRSVQSLRNRLNSANLALSIAQKHLERGQPVLAESTLGEALRKFAQEVPSVPATPSPQANFSSLASVLLVENNPEESSLLAELLRLSGMDVRVAANSQEALQRMGERVPDVVLLDMQVSDGDGPTILERIREVPDFQHVVIYGVAGMASSDSGLRTCPGGVRGWFQKPVQSNLLVQTIKKSATSTLAC